MLIRLLSFAKELLWASEIMQQKCALAPGRSKEWKRGLMKLS